jgi:hypothetical protein
MRILCSIIQVSAGSMTNIRKQRPVSNAVATLTIGDNALGFVLQSLLQSLEQTLGSRSISSLLHQNVQHDTVLIHRTP